MEQKVKNYIDSLTRLSELRQHEVQVKTDIDKAIYDLKSARDELRDTEYELITK